MKHQDHAVLADLSVELDRLCGQVKHLAEGKSPQQVYRPSPSLKSRHIDFVRAILAKRRDFENRFGKELFGDPVRDMLLDLYINELQNRRVYVSSLGIASAVPPTTALRQMASLIAKGWIIKRADPRDGRRSFLELSKEALEHMEAWVDGALGSFRKAIG